jgi:electron transfer flavoprotein beta subunit
MSLNIVVLAKQVPDTRNVGKDAMKEDGTINRAALPAIFNPEDLNALEQALRLKDANPGSTVTILTMGLPRAAEVIREAMFRGADTGIVLTDRALGGADTLATSYSLAQAIKKMDKVDIVLCGRQAIDGDTAQVGPQVAEKLGMPQVTYAEEILSIADGKATIRRRIESGVETVKAPMPLVVTVNGSAPDCRPRNAKRVMQFKYAVSPSEKEKLSDELKALVDKRPGLNLQEWSAAFVEADPEQIGMPGSPTKVKAIENVVFTAKENLVLENNDEQIENLVKTLIANHTIG